MEEAIKIYNRDWDREVLSKIGLETMPEQLMQKIEDGNAILRDVNALIDKLDKADTGKKIEDIIIDESSPLMKRISEYTCNGLLRMKLMKVNETAEAVTELTDEEKAWFLRSCAVMMALIDDILKGYMNVVQAQERALSRLLHPAV